MKQLISIVFVFLAAQAFAQITFIHSTLEEALALAKKENKPLFVDVYATWCGPCKRMAATTFEDPTVVAFYNANFINLKVDGEKNDGPEVMKKYSLSAYPTLLYFFPDGRLATQFVGGMDVEEMMKKGKFTVDPSNDPVTKARASYFKSKKQTPDLKKYIAVMDSQKDDSLAFYAKQYLSKQPKLSLKDPAEFAVFLSQINDYQHPLSKAFLAHPEDVERTVLLEKISVYLRESFQTAKDKNDFAYMEQTIETLYPILEAQKAEQLPTKAEFVAYCKEQFENE